MLATRTWTLYRGRLFIPIAVFTGFLLLGLAWGVGRGGAPLVAYWEIRALLYLPVLFVLVTNLLDRPKQYRVLLWLIMVVAHLQRAGRALGVLLIDARGAGSARQPRRARRRGARRRPDRVHCGDCAHPPGVLISATVGAARAWPCRSSWAFMLAERRAAMVALVRRDRAASSIVLRWHHRRRFWWFVPIVALVG